MEFEKLLDNRWSCRSFSDAPVPGEMVDQIIAAALKAPTARNIQNFMVWVLSSQRATEAVKASTRFTFGAPLFFLVGHREENAWVRGYDGHIFGDVDTSIVATHMMLEIANLGLGTTWVGSFDAPKLQELLPETAGYELLALFPTGFPAPDAVPGPLHSVSKTPEQVSIKL